ncbi:MAG TPA: sialidase family protein, partial [Longimicrobium sp.]|nr:sialidase family protein [Longimicrobium sp.]
EDEDRDRRGDQVLYTRADGGAWTEPERLDAGPGLSESPRVVVDGRGRVHVLWYEAMDPARPAAMTDLLHRVWDAGRWSAAESLYREPAPAGLGDLSLAATVDGGGRVQVVHTRAAGGAAHLTLGLAGPARPLGQEVAYPAWDAARGADGGLGMVYVAARASVLQPSANNDVYFQELRGGRWSAPVPVHVSAAWAYEPALATDARGVRHVVWLQGWKEGRSDRVMHATSRDGVTWSEPADVTPAVPGGDFQAPRLSLDAAGRVRLLVTRHEGQLGRPRHWQMELDGGRWSAAVQLFPDLGPARSHMETAATPGGPLHALWRGGDGAYRHATLN